MKRIQIRLEDGAIVGEGCASEGKDLTEAIETLTPMLKMFPKAKLVIENTTKEEFNKEIKKHFEKTYEIPCYLNIKATSEEEAYNEALKMSLDIPELTIDTSNFVDKEDLKIFLFEECDRGMYPDGSLISWEEKVFIVAPDEETAEDLFYKDYENCYVGPTELSREEADVLGFHNEELEIGVYC